MTRNIAEDEITRIISLCLSLDKKASEIYANMAATAEKPAYAAFWNDMSDQEKEHTAFWERLLDLSKKGLIPQIFSNPFNVIKQLESTLSIINVLTEKSTKALSITEAFLNAYQLEFHMVNPEFEALFNFIKTVMNDKTPRDNYENHLKGLLTMLQHLDVSTPELKFLGETILRFWRLTRNLAVQSHIDPLTSIFNRRGLFNAIKPIAHLAKRNHYPISVMMIDIDHFKTVNDTYGHQIGDVILGSVAQSIKSNVRSSDIVGRYGGEEFLVFASPLDVKTAEAVAEKLRSLIANDANLKVTVSIGVSCGYIEHDVDNSVRQFIKKADESLYDAKRNGRNKIVMYNALQIKTE